MGVFHKKHYGQFLLLFFLAMNSVIDAKETIQIYAISTSFTVGKSIQKGYQLAIDDINNNRVNNTLLMNYTLSLEVSEQGDDSTTALVHALKIAGSDTNNTIPIVLGCDWSSLSTVTAPTLAAFDIAQIASASTSDILSQTSSFEYFYRTIANDNVQAMGIVHLCQQFDWTKIGIIHVNDNYGVYLAVAISELAVATGSIEVSSIAFERHDHANGSYSNAVKAMQDIGVYVMVIISHGDEDLVSLFKAFKQNEMLGYPYYFVATDGWLDQNVIDHMLTHDYKSTDFQGIIGTLPWQPTTFEGHNAHSHYYKAGLSEMQETAYEIYSNIQSDYDDLYDNDTYMGTRLIYGYDSMMLLAHVMDELDDENGTLQQMFDGLISPGQALELISQTILNISFVGATGNVTLNNVTGDRDHGLYGFGCINDSGDIDYFGYIHYSYVDGINDSVFYEVVDDVIKWPQEFEDKDIIPQSQDLKKNEVLTIDEGLFVAIITLASLGIAALVIYVLFLIFSNKISEKSNFAMNIVIYLGVVAVLTNIIIWGVDEALYPKSSDTLDSLCNVRVWLFVTSFTLVFSPSFAKSYKLSKIFTELRIKKTIPDSAMLMRCFVALLIDIVLLIVFTAISPFTRIYWDATNEPEDDLIEIQYAYGVCRIEDNAVSYAFWVCVGSWKLCQLIFGFYQSIIVSRMGFKIPIWTMCVICMIFCVDAILLIFGPNTDVNFAFCVVAFTQFFIVAIIVFQRYFANIILMIRSKHDEDGDKKHKNESDEKKMIGLLKRRLQEIAKEENIDGNSLRDVAKDQNIDGNSSVTVELQNVTSHNN